MASSTDRTDDTVAQRQWQQTETIAEASANGTVEQPAGHRHDADGVTGSANNYVNYGSGLAA